VKGVNYTRKPTKENSSSKSRLIMEIPQKLKDYLDSKRSVYIDDLPPVTDPDQPLNIDSLGLIRLVAFLENEFGYRIEDEELIAENFTTLRKLGQLLATKTPTDPTAEAKTRSDGAIPSVPAENCANLRTVESESEGS